MTEQSPKMVLDYASRPVPQRPQGPSARKLVGWSLFVVLAIVLLLMMSGHRATGPEISFANFEDRLLAGDVRELSIDYDEIAGAFNRSVTIGGRSLTAFRTPLPRGLAENWSMVRWVMDNRHGADVRLVNSENLLINLLVSLIPWLLIFGFLWFFVLRQWKKQLAARKEPTPVVIVNKTEAP